MSVVNFPDKPKTSEDWPWEPDLCKPYVDINQNLDPSFAKTPFAQELLAAMESDRINGNPSPSPASEILRKASGLIDGERNVQHGDRKECHTLIARLWTAYLGVQITAKEVALMMCLLKIARTKSGSYNGDCYVDLCGYGSLAGELAKDA